MNYNRTLIILVTGILISLIARQAAISAEEMKLTGDQVELIENLQKQGVISIDLRYNEVRVDPGWWNPMLIKMKERYAQLLAVYCGNRSEHSYWVHITDMYSGKKIAKWSTLGFKTY